MERLHEGMAIKQILAELAHWHYTVVALNRLLAESAH